MVRLDLTIFKYLTAEDFRVLLAIELGMRNHEYVPVDLIEILAKIKRAGVVKVIQHLLKNKLIEHCGQKYDGYALNYLGYDFLAIRALLKKGLLVKILPRMGVGKESDVFHCFINRKGVTKELSDEDIAKAQLELIEEFKNEDDDVDFDDFKIEEKSIIKQDNLQNESVMKIKHSEIHVDDYNQLKDIYSSLKENYDLIPGILKLGRLGRTSFRAVKSKRDFVKNKSHYNWLYLSRLSAQTESKFLNGLYSHGFPVPQPFGYNRHAIVMEFIPGYQLSRVTEIQNPEKVYNNLTSIIYKLAESGLVHGDYNEFNVIISEDEKITVIDFTQMISRDHEQAELYFKRDLKGIRKFFMKKFHLTTSDDELSEESRSLENVKRLDFLDVKFNAFGSIKKHEDNSELDIIDKNNDIEYEDDHMEMLKEKDDLNNVFTPNEANLDITNNNKIDENSIIITKKDILKNVMNNINKQNKTKTKHKGKGGSGKNNIKQKDLD